MQISLFRNVALSMMVVHVFSFVALGACISIFVTLGYTFVNVCISINGCTLASTTSSFCVACASTNCCSITLSSSNSSMFTRSTNVAPSLACSLELQPFLCLYKNLIVDVPDLYILWIIVCENYISSLYALPSSHFKDDGECDNDLTTNNWMFSILAHFAFLNSSSTSIFLNNSTSSSCFCLCFLFFTSFSFVIIYNFSIALLTLILLEHKKHTTFDNKWKQQ